MADRVDVRVVPGVPLCGGPIAAMLGMAAWGVGLGAQKAVLKADIVGMVASGRRGTAYGL